ncbi:transmembrane protein 106A [Aplochiton taeniatus]
MVTLGQSSTKEPEGLLDKHMEKRRPSQTPVYYGSINGDHLRDTCPTCRGIGRIPRGEQDQLVAVIPCSDKRLKPTHTKLYVFISMVVCLLLCCLILFFLFPRSITLSPVSVQSVMVYFTPNTVDMQVTNTVNISNANFVTVQILEFDVQVLVFHTVVGKIKITNMTSLKSCSQKVYTIEAPVSIEDSDLNFFCKSPSIKIHTLYLHLQMTMNVSYLAHSEQVSADTFEYIDCGANTTIPHPIVGLQ